MDLIIETFLNENCIKLIFSVKNRNARAVPLYGTALVFLRVLISIYIQKSTDYGKSVERKIYFPYNEVTKEGGTWRLKLKLTAHIPVQS